MRSVAGNSSADFARGWSGAGASALVSMASRALAMAVSYAAVVAKACLASCQRVARLRAPALASSSAAMAG